MYYIHAVDVVPPRLQINKPQFSSEEFTLSWTYDEEATSTCRLQPSSLLSDNNMQHNMTTIIPCSNNSVSLKSAQKHYSLYIQGIDKVGNIADPVQFTWDIGIMP